MQKKWEVVKFVLVFMLGFTILSANVIAQCNAPGWASLNGGVTGGGSATPTVVSTYAALKTALTTSSVKVVHIQGTISFPMAGKITIQDQSGKSIIGLPGSKMVSVDQTASGSGIFYVKRCTNILFKNLNFEGPGAYDTDGNDNMTIDQCTNVWVDHCEFHDAVDGNLDIKNAADLISITWCKFSYEKAPRAGGSGGADDHRFSNLFGSSDNATGDRGHLRITMQNCWWAEGCKERMPRIRFGKIHMVNNLFSSSVANYCIRAGFEADILAEGNYFLNQPIPIDPYENKFTAIKAVNNYGAVDMNKGTAFTPPYSLTVAAPATIVDPIKSCAGAKLSSPTACNCGSTTVNTPPIVSITAPANNASFTSPANITITANASDANGTVANVQFYNGSTLLGSDASTPYTFSWSNVAAGTYTITAKATDNEGATTTSSAVTVVVTTPANTPPTISLTAPSNNSTFTAPANILITANAADANGTVSNVQFYSGSTLLGTDASAPYTFTWSNVAAGTYTITAKATDNVGATTTSSAVSLTVNATPAAVTIQAETACAADGILNETVNGGYHGSGYVNLNNALNTKVSWVVNSAAAQKVRLNIRYANASSNGRSMFLTVNGSVQISSIPFTSTGAWTIWNTAGVDVNLAAGRNTILLTSLTNEGSPNIDELVFNGSGVSTASCTAPNQAPTINISSPSNNASFTAPASVNISANAADADGTISNVQFFSGNTLLGNDATAPYTFTWNNVASGTYSVTAVATDNVGAVTTSSAITIVVSNPVSSPATLTKHGSGSATQTVKLGASIVEFSYTWTNATTVSVTGLPSGIKVTIDNAGNNVIISGTPSQTGTFAFTVSTVGGNPNVSKEGTITVTSSSAKLGFDNTDMTLTKVSPNPSVQSFQITLKESATVVRVYNMSGVQQYEFENIDSDFTFGNELAPGLYMVIIEYADGGTESLKIQKN